MPSIPIVEAAVSYAQNGWPVFPLHNKIPFKDSQGYKDATTDEQQIQKWWTLHPTANIGLATGEKSGVIVLDIDPPEGLWWPALSRHKKRVR
ncbi:MAG: bifunctional DNA primase/polymerase [Ktedonobacteraceae bacterium]